MVNTAITYGRRLFCTESPLGCRVPYQKRFGNGNRPESPGIAWQKHVGRPPSFQRDVQDPVAVLQLCVDNRCLIFQIIHSGQFPPLSLINFLNNPNITFTGVGINTDIQKLVSHGLGRGPNGQSFASKMVNLQQVAAQKFGRSMDGLSMNVLARDLLGIPAKPENVRISA
ncbi:Werner syndrome-like exonuclease [Tanacetum coccineum]